MVPPYLSFPTWKARRGLLPSQVLRHHDPSFLLSEWQASLLTPGRAAG